MKTTLLSIAAALTFSASAFMMPSDANALLALAGNINCNYHTSDGPGGKTLLQCKVNEKKDVKFEDSELCEPNDTQCFNDFKAECKKECEKAGGHMMTAERSVLTTLD